ESFHREVREAAVRTLAEVAPGGAVVTSRLTHVYPDGAAPYFTVIAPGPPGALVAAWDAVKVAVSETILTAGGTITHHHAVGRDHQPYYARQVPPLFGEVLQAAKRQLDPRGILNPGCLLAGS
ncbi:MAG: hypothetical protein KC731_13215, partial [Myxococcales bacterium]|nr:hypothetical protein [Myxococcales bacterium]